MATKFAFAFTALCLCVCISHTAFAEDSSFLEIRTVQVNKGLVGITPDRRLVGVNCPAGFKDFILGTQAQLVFPKRNGGVDLNFDFSPNRVQLVPADHGTAKPLSVEAGKAICSVESGVFQLAIFADRVELLKQVHIQAQSFDDILEAR